MSAAVTPPFARLAEAYETVRQRWHGQDSSAHGRLGLDLLLRQGLSPWMRVVAATPIPERDGTDAAVSRPVPATAGEGAAAASVRRTEVAALVVSMAWAATQKETP
jgi:hypothetical protein